MHPAEQKLRDLVDWTYNSMRNDRLELQDKGIDPTRLGGTDPETDRVIARYRANRHWHAMVVATIIDGCRTDTYHAALAAADTHVLSRIDPPYLDSIFQRGALR